MPETQEFRPRGWRVALAFLLAPFLAVFLPWLAMELYGGGKVWDILGRAVADAIFFAILGAYPITLFFGLPLYVLLNGRVGYGPVAPIIVGYAIVAAGLTLLELMDHPLDREGLAVTAVAALAGGLGGFIFWLIAVWRDPRRRQ